MWHKLSRKSMFIASYILYCRDTRLDVYGFSGDQIQCMDSRFGGYNTKKSIVDLYLILVACCNENLCKDRLLFLELFLEYNPIDNRSIKE